MPSTIPPVAVSAVRRPVDRATIRRLIGVGVALCAAVILGVAAYLKPSPEGLGTHPQLYMPECGWIMLMDLPCPTCGMTTAFAHAAEGHLVASLATQPLGGILAIATAIALLSGLYVAATGSQVAVLFGRLCTRRAAWGLSAVVVGAWIYKILLYRGILG